MVLWSATQWWLSFISLNFLSKIFSQEKRSMGIMEVAVQGRVDCGIYENAPLNLSMTTPLLLHEGHTSHKLLSPNNWTGKDTKAGPSCGTPLLAQGPFTGLAKTLLNLSLRLFIPISPSPSFHHRGQTCISVLGLCPPPLIPRFLLFSLTRISLDASLACLTLVWCLLLQQT